MTAVNMASMAIRSQHLITPEKYQQASISH